MQDQQTAANTPKSDSLFSGFLMGVIVLSILEILFGLILLPFYKPTTAEAYSSLQTIQSSPVLNFIQDAHHWLSAGLILFGGLTLLYGLFAGAHGEVGKLPWVASVLFVASFL